MFDPQHLLGQLLGDALGGSFGKRGKRGGLSFSTKAQIGIGALGLAMAAFEHFKGANPSTPAPQSVTPPPAPLPTHFAGPATPPPPPAAPMLDRARLAPEQADAVLLVQSMIAAAGADGLIDPSERQRILQRATSAGIDAQTFAFLESELATPKSAAEIGAMTRPGLIREAYLAALLAIDLDQASEQRFLDTLGDALGLSADVRAELVRQVEAS